MAQLDWQHLCSTGMQVRSLAWHSGLRIRRCHICGLVYNSGSDLIPGPGTPYAMGRGSEMIKSNKRQEFMP